MVDRNVGNKEGSGDNKNKAKTRRTKKVLKKHERSSKLDRDHDLDLIDWTSYVPNDIFL